MHTKPSIARFDLRRVNFLGLGDRKRSPTEETLTREVMQAEIHHLESNDHVDWNDFVKYRSPDAYDDYGWFHVTIGTSDMTGGNDFQVCVATPRAVGRIKRDGIIPGILVDEFDPATVEMAIRDRVNSVRGHSWEQIVNRLREFMHWDYEGMAGS